MDELVRWLAAQLDEDEQIARRAGDSFRQIGETGVIVATEGDRAEECASTNWAGIAEHIVEHDPARVLCEIDAKRQLLALHEPSTQPSEDSDIDQLDDQSTWVTCCGTCQVTVVHPGDWPCETLRLLLLPYEARPGYREEWRP